MIRPSPRTLILGFALAWGIVAFLRETGRTLAALDDPAHSRAAVAYWQLGSPRVEPLDRCLALVREKVPPGRVVAFASPEDSPPFPNAAFFRWRWAAYLLPRHDVVSFEDLQARETAEYLISYQRDLAIPRLEPVAGTAECRLYRVLTPSP